MRRLPADHTSEEEEERAEEGGRRKTILLAFGMSSKQLGFI